MNKKIISEKKYCDFDCNVIPHINSLKRYALKLTNDFDNSEDLLQDTLLKAFRFFESFEEGSNAKAWLFKIMKNSFINNYRKKTKQPATLDYDDVHNFYENIKVEDIVTLHYQPDSFDNALEDQISQALSILPDDFRTIIYLCDIEGYSYQEASDFVECPVGTVRSRLHRTRKTLYALLFKYALENGFIRSEKPQSVNVLQ
jgi:RNA polymerase sigma-70 factor, ECF subfamily